MARTRKFNELPYRQQVAYCLKRLADPTIHPVDRNVIEGRLRDLGCRCVKCGRAIENEESRKAWERDGFGPECREKQVAS